MFPYQLGTQVLESVDGGQRWPSMLIFGPLCLSFGDEQAIFFEFFLASNLAFDSDLQPDRALCYFLRLKVGAVRHGQLFIE